MAQWVKSKQQALPTGHAFLHPDSYRAPGGFHRVQPGQRGSAGYHHLGLDGLTPLTDMNPEMRLQPPPRPPASGPGHGPKRWGAWKPFWKQKIQLNRVDLPSAPHRSQQIYVVSWPQQPTRELLSTHGGILRIL